jgi:hypothetical protein
VITQAISALFAPNSLIELRVLKTSHYADSLYFTDHALAGEVAEACSKDEGTRACWFTLNKIDPAILQDKTRNIILNSYANLDPKSRVKRSTENADILSYQWLLVDVDPTRTNGESKSNATKEEKTAAMIVAEKVSRCRCWQLWVASLAAGQEAGGLH